MKKILLFTLCFAFSSLVKAQAPVIEGDLMLCPYTDGTATIVGGQTYDSYQWYYKYWFLSDDFVAIDGATEASFTYDWMTYDQALLKVEVTIGGETYESNELQIDSHNWASMTVIGEMGDPANVFFDPDLQVFLLCDGTTFPNTVNSPYTANIQWYKDDEPIPGATSATYEIHEAGTYYVRASPFVCPDQPENVGTSLPIVVEKKTDCTASVKNPEAHKVALYPNPAQNELNLGLSENHDFSSFAIYDITGKILISGEVTASINIAALASGTYILKLTGEQVLTTKQFIKE